MLNKKEEISIVDLFDEWMEENRICYEWIKDDVVEIEDFGKMYVFDSVNVDAVLCGSDKLRLITPVPKEELIDEGVIYAAIKWGNNFYYVNMQEDVELNILKYIGKYKRHNLKDDYINLGVHSPFELLNGSFLPNEWAKKAKFMGHNAIGICDQNTLAGTFPLQKACQKYGIKPIFGYSLQVRAYGEKFCGKVYCLTNEGWGNILRIQKSVMVDNVSDPHITIDELCNRGAGNVFVFDKLSAPHLSVEIVKEITASFDQSYYQFDLTEYKADRFDREVLMCFQDYLNDWRCVIEPILICDNYYLDKDDAKNKVILNKIDIGTAHLQSDEQYYKSLYDHVAVLSPLFEDFNANQKDGFTDAELIETAARNTVKVANDANAVIETGKLYSPEYEQSPEEYAKYKGDNHALFLDLIEDGFKRLVPRGCEKKYRDRLNEEIYVIESTNNVDYFLMTANDSVGHGHRSGIQVGTGRGSAGGCIISYLLGIITINPMTYDLIFERFLTPDRCGLIKQQVSILNEDITIQAGEESVLVGFADGSSMDILPDSEVMVLRNEEKIQVYADEIQVDDFILVDRKEELYDIPEIMNQKHTDFRITSVEVSPVDCETVITDFTVGEGFLLEGHAALPDIDTDFASDGRVNIKEHLEEKYNADGTQNCFSAGTFTTLKVKAALKDIGKTYGIPHKTVNYITSMIEDDAMTFTGIFAACLKEKSSAKKLRAFVNTYPQLIEDIRTILNQPKSTSIHASAFVITPKYKDGKRVECFDYLPIRMVDGQLVSEFDGTAVDELGLLKLDLLATKELMKIRNTLNLVNEHYPEKVAEIMESIGRRGDLNMDIIHTDLLKDPKVFKMLSAGYTQNVFQFSGAGITKFVKELMPDCVGDIIAANALYRPATMEIGAPDDYIKYKRGEAVPVYNWKTEEALRDTYGLIVYQEQVMRLAQLIGDFSLADSAALMKVVSKKKIDKIIAMKDQFMEGARKQGAPMDDVEDTWRKIEAAGSYLFNKCVSGKTRIKRGGGSGKYIPTIAEMYKIKNDSSYARLVGEYPLHKMYKYRGYGKSWSVGDEASLVINSINDIYYQGKRETYKLTTESGRSVSTTLNHKFPTNNGEKMLCDILIGDLIMVEDGYKVERSACSFTDMGSPNRYHKNGCSEKYSLNVQKGTMGFISRNRETSYTQLAYYKKNLKKNTCELCGKSDCRIEVHHINNDHTDNKVCNLISLCSSCHKKKHYEIGRVKRGEKGLLIRWEKVKSIEFDCVEDVYDVEMNSPHHTFTIDNGIVTCNSHAAAYGLTAYDGAWLKANFPTAFYTVALQFAEDDNLKALMGEMAESSNCKIVPPDINQSGKDFMTNYETDEIFWSLTKISHVGAKAVNIILEDREEFGLFQSIEDFYVRIAARCKTMKQDAIDEEKKFTNPINIRVLKHMVLTGCFDNLWGAKSVVDRFHIMEEINHLHGSFMDEKEFPKDMLDKQYYWAKRQIDLSGFGSIDYQRIYNSSEAKRKIKGYGYLNVDEALKTDSEGKRCAVCATIIEVTEKSGKSKDGKPYIFGKIVFQQNNDVIECSIWNETWSKYRPMFINNTGRIAIVTANVKYSSFNNGNGLSCGNNAIVEII